MVESPSLCAPDLECRSVHAVAREYFDIADHFELVFLELFVNVARSIAADEPELEDIRHELTSTIGSKVEKLVSTIILCHNFACQDIVGSIKLPLEGNRPGVWRVFVIDVEKVVGPTLTARSGRSRQIHYNKPVCNNLGFLVDGSIL